MTAAGGCRRYSNCIIILRVEKIKIHVKSEQLNANFYQIFFLPDQHTYTHRLFFFRRYFFVFCPTVDRQRCELGERFFIFNLYLPPKTQINPSIVLVLFRYIQYCLVFWYLLAPSNRVVRDVDSGSLFLAQHVRSCAVASEREVSY